MKDLKKAMNKILTNFAGRRKDSYTIICVDTLDTRNEYIYTIFYIYLISLTRNLCRVTYTYYQFILRLDTLK